MAAKSPESFMFTVGKLDAGMAILLGERAHLIEFPSILLPPGATAGSIVNIAVHRNVAEEKRRDADFWQLQKDIYRDFGVDMPRAPDLQLRNITQTSVTLEWPSLHMATAKLRSLDIYRNAQRLAAIPQPLTNTSTKLSGLALDTDYTFQLVLRTTAGTYPSNIIRARTHTMADTSGVCVCFGTVSDARVLEQAKEALREMRARWSDKIQIDTTHFVCTTPAATPAGAGATGGVSSGPGVEYQRALQLSIPVVQPTWVLACNNEKKMVSIAPFYLGATPSTASTHHQASTRTQSVSHASLPRSPSSKSPPLHSPTGTGTGTGASSHRASMPPPARADPTPGDAPSLSRPAPGRVDEEEGDLAQEEEEGEEEGRRDSEQQRRSPVSRRRQGTMNRDFKFPPPEQVSPPPPVPAINPAAVAAASGPNTSSAADPSAGAEDDDADAVEEEERPRPRAPSIAEVPPPPPVEKERVRQEAVDDGDEDVGETVDIPL
ncbi:hypothetical protein BD410DRAFT_759264 [Rickenella mellea]|uniref:Uncharacterized protein n=1 Tax=Rickenella mellea TaxID=50990 RepID=A0A4R5XGZ9_9AGAM|nr:hypothetical protein BD410DRAFT_759264 [Rickenella mellea]